MSYFILKLSNLFSYSFFNFSFSSFIFFSYFSIIFLIFIINKNDYNNHRDILGEIEKKYDKENIHLNYEKKIENLNNIKKLSELVYNTYNTYTNNYYNAKNISNIILNYNKSGNIKNNKIKKLLYKNLKLK